jgi:flagellar biosynthesis/type III secretory pathway M-ring protein FliF/YscJ
MRPLARVLLPPAAADNPAALEASGGPLGAALPTMPDFAALPSMGDGFSTVQGDTAGKRQDELLRERLQTLVAADEAKVARVLKTWMAETEKA